MTTTQLTQKAKQLKQQMSARRIPKATIKEIILLLKCKEKENYKHMFSTKLYNKYSGEYCEYLELI